MSQAARSVKHLTCWFWASQGQCKFSDDGCKYSHFHTGHMSEQPVRVQPDMPAMAGLNLRTHLSQEPSTALSAASPTPTGPRNRAPEHFALSTSGSSESRSTSRFKASMSESWRMSIRAQAVKKASIEARNTVGAVRPVPRTTQHRAAVSRSSAVMAMEGSSMAAVGGSGGLEWQESTLVEQLKRTLVLRKGMDEGLARRAARKMASLHVAGFGVSNEGTISIFNTSRRPSTKT